ncbi:MAG: type II toxin-antitoxin system RelE/ParE family toxin [Desulfarculus sp.]|nr:type II toxin-antitoxin system RelE/ParE family toxin [Desulfarculus sp.]
MATPGKWSIEFYGEAVRREFRGLPDDMRAFFHSICKLIQDVGLENVGMPYIGPLENCKGLWEMRLRGQAGIARAVYATQKGKKIVVLRVFIKKTQKTPKNELDICKQRQRELENEKANQR